MRRRVILEYDVEAFTDAVRGQTEMAGARLLHVLMNPDDHAESRAVMETVYGVRVAEDNTTRLQDLDWTPLSWGLQMQEIRMLNTIMTRPGITPAELFEAVWCHRNIASPRNVVAARVSGMRRKLARHGIAILSAREMGGYRLRPEDQRALEEMKRNSLGGSRDDVAMEDAA